MVGILIIAHDTLGESLISCASHVMGAKQLQLMQLGVTVNDDPQQLLEQARSLVKTLDQGDGVLVFCDIYGATPSNIACRLLVPGKVEGIAGVSLPMLVRALTYRNELLSTLVAKALSGGRECTVYMTLDSCNAATGS